MFQYNKTTIQICSISRSGIFMFLHDLRSGTGCSAGISSGGKDLSGTGCSAGIPMGDDDWSFSGLVRVSWGVNWRWHLFHLYSAPSSALTIYKRGVPALWDTTPLLSHFFSKSVPILTVLPGCKGDRAITPFQRLYRRSYDNFVCRSLALTWSGLGKLGCRADGKVEREVRMWRPSISWEGLQPVAEITVSLYIISPNHESSCRRIRFAVCTACSASPLALDSCGLVVTWLKQYLSTNSLTSDDTNCGPLSEINLLRIPQMEKTSFSFAMKAEDVLLLTCKISIHLE